ncbi:hypothetical protein KY290_036970 [Solanum tuberosum]|uniref:Integrase core domain containing protein n=1 Tax=Solanum tuberosum TaxID=4113 RepID=A0ABQ7TUP8_SOLTU|nr:hypothetical protein KY289_036461 [Solanum tuberosum]KAH0738265.1 hypothetical protein KY290_036970 [Solanum tuberosum]
MVGFKRSRKGETSGTSGSPEPVQKFGKKAVQRYGWEWFACQHEAKYMGDEFVNELRLQSQFPDIYQTVNELGLRWERSKDTGRHNTLYFANFNQVAQGMPINVEAILRQNMMKFRNNLKWRFCYGGLITHFLRDKGIEEETVDMTTAYHPDLTKRQARDDSVMAIMFGMAELQLQIGGHPVTDEEIETLADRYPLTESAAFLCRSGPAFMEPLDDDEVTADVAMDDAGDEEANALMVFNGGDDEA